MGRRAGFWLGLSVGWIPLAFLFDGVTVLVLPLRLDADAATLGVVSMIGLGIAAGLQPVAGWLSDQVRDRLDRRTFLAVAAVPAVGGLWLLAETTTLFAALLGYILLQGAATAMQAAQQTLIPEHLERSEQGRGSGLKAAFDVGGSFLAFLLLGTLLVSGDLFGTAVAITVLVGLAVALVFVLVPPVERLQASVRSRVGLRPGLGRLIVARFLLLFATYGVGRFLVLLVAERLDLDPARAVGDAGALLALFTLATAGCAVPAGWLADRRASRDVMAAGAAIGAIGIVVLVPSAGHDPSEAGGDRKSVV